jgi:hypothetical protein
MAQAVSHRSLSRRNPVFPPWLVHVGCVVDKVTLLQAFLLVLRFSLVSIIPPWLSILIYYLGDERYVRWWSQLRDVVLPHRHEQLQQNSMRYYVTFQ